MFIRPKTTQQMGDVLCTAEQHEIKIRPSLRWGGVAWQYESTNYGIMSRQTQMFVKK